MKQVTYEFLNSKEMSEHMKQELIRLVEKALEENVLNPSDLENEELMELFIAKTYENLGSYLEQDRIVRNANKIMKNLEKKFVFIENNEMEDVEYYEEDDFFIYNNNEDAIFWFKTEEEFLEQYKEYVELKNNFTPFMERTILESIRNGGFKSCELERFYIRSLTDDRSDGKLNITLDYDVSHKSGYYEDYTVFIDISKEDIINQNIRSELRRELDEFSKETNINILNDISNSRFKINNISEVNLSQLIEVADYLYTEEFKNTIIDFKDGTSVQSQIELPIQFNEIGDSELLLYLLDEHVSENFNMKVDMCYVNLDEKSGLLNYDINASLYSLNYLGNGEDGKNLYQIEGEIYRRIFPTVDELIEINNNIVAVMDNNVFDFQKDEHGNARMFYIDEDKLISFKKDFWNKFDSDCKYLHENLSEVLVKNSNQAPTLELGMDR